ncbi:MAG: SH3 domain-containing protein, partial [Treponema sp.]|nr:SH3 domain-containing protein [Treponema sp.]
MKRFLCLALFILCAGSFAFSQAGARRYVAVKTAALKASNSALAKDVGNLSLGDEVSLLKDDGKWAQVNFGNLSGWVASASLSSRRVVASGSTASVSEVALAGKGFSPDVEIEYRKNGLDYSMVDSMEKIIIPADELERFIT